MDTFFEILSWAAMVALVGVSIPQIILNYKRKSTEGVSWPMFGILSFGLGVMAIRSWLTGADIVLLINYSLGALISLIANIQIFYYRILKRG